MSTTTDFSEYSVRVSADPSFYGAECTIDEGKVFADRLSNLLRQKFPGIRIRDFGLHVAGPKSDTVEEIERFVENNWIQAL